VVVIGCLILLSASLELDAYRHDGLLLVAPGHLFPAIALAEQLPDYQIEWLGVPNRLETQLCQPSTGYTPSVLKDFKAF